jgi:hypothetical protein
VFLSPQKHIPIKTIKHRKYYTTAISVEALHKYQDKLIILGTYVLERQSEIRTILYALNSIHIGNANVPPTQEKLSHAYKAVVNLMLRKKTAKTKKKTSSQNNVYVNSFYVYNNELYGIQTTYSNKIKSFITKVYKYNTKSDRWEIDSKLNHEINSEDVEGVGLIVHAADLIGPYIIRAEIIIPENVIQRLTHELKTKSSEAIENAEYELEISARVIVVDISTLNYVTALEHTYYIKEKLKFLNEIINSYGADKKETYLKIIKETKKINIEKIFKIYIKSIRLKYSYLSGEYNYTKNEFSNLVIEPILIVESELDTISTIVIKKALDLGDHKIESIMQISNVLATNIMMAVENKGRLTSYFQNPKLKGFSNDGRIFCYYAILEKTIGDEKIRLPVTIIHAWDDKSASFYQYIYDKDAARSVIGYIEDKQTKKSVGIVFSTYKEGYIVIALIDTKNNTIIVQEFKKTYQNFVYNSLSVIARMLCGKRYTVNKPSIGEFEYNIRKGEVLTAFKVKRFYDNVEVNYWNGLCKRYMVISDYPKQQCAIYIPNLRGIIKEDTFTFLHDEIEMLVLGTRRIIKRENNTCIFFELQNPVLIIKGPDLSSL